MQKAKRPQWRKLDNAALLFPASTGKRHSRVFRFYCQLKEEIDAGILQSALDETMRKYPLYQSVMRKGLFWFYLEQSEITPVVTAETRPPCSKLYIPDQKTLLFEVSYFQNRINFEVYHGLTDGTGAMCFLKELVRNYLRLRYPETEFPEVNEEEQESRSGYEEDSFSQYYSKDGKKKPEKGPAAFQLSGEWTEQDQILELELSASEVHRRAKEYGVSVTVFLASALLFAIHQDVPRSKQKKPVTLMIPVNLRNYFPSASMTNFFGWIEAGYPFREDTTLEEVMQHVKQVFQRELVKERIAQKLNELVSLEKNPFLRIVPLEIKNLAISAGANVRGKSITAVFSNLGRIQLPEVYSEYIVHFGFFTSTDKMQLCTCSYGDKLVLGLTTKLLSDNIQKNFKHILRRQEIEIKETENEAAFPGAIQKPEGLVRKALKGFTFLCIAVVVICWMIDLILSPMLAWAGFVIAGAFCTWVMVMVAYRKRKNLLKNGMWQLIIVSIVSILWDLFTKWNGWSIDFVLPLASLVVIISMTAVARVYRMKEAEYLFYLVQAGAFGCIPAALMAFHLVTVRYPSVICSGISILYLAGIVVFKGRALLRELHKKFRV